MSDARTNAPKIRFRGFTEDWEQRKAKEIFISKVEKNQPELPVLSVTQDSGVVYRNQLGIDIKYDRTTLKNYKVIRKGDFIISLRSFQGGFELSDKLGITSPAYTIFVPKNMNSQDNLFWKIKFKTFTFIESLKTVTFGIRDGKAISFSEFGDLKLFFPKNIEEQQKIGTFFKQLDDTIALHQRELDLLKQTKQTYLQKMFPKSGENKPEIRFAGFTDAWEQRKLKEITERVRGNDGRMDLPTLTISAGSGWLDQRERFSGNIAGKEQKNYTLLKKGQLSYNHGNSKLAKYGAVFELKTYNEALVPRVYHSFGTNELSNPNFIEYMFATKRPDKELTKLVSSGARMDGLLNINFDEFMGINVNIPSVGEQKKIGSFFEQLDDTITLHQRKLDSLKEMKKSLLQQMFV
jgi:type I restriction enzyme S subunit